MVYVFEDICGLTDEWYHKALTVLPTSRQKKAMRYRNAIDRKTSILTYLLLSFGMQLEYQHDGLLSFCYNENGKPYLVEYQNIYFNFSHCTKGVTCAIADSEIGIDIQESVSIDDTTLCNICSEMEIIQLQESQDAERLLSRIWTLKESYLKYKGIGLIDELMDIDFSLYLKESSFEAYNCCFDSYDFCHYSLSICTEKPRNQMYFVTLNDLFKLCN